MTIICQGNGFGKSTFAAFIKAMFYGFPRTGARNIVENERKRYDPWQGGKYGGYLEFKIQDTSYRVTRYFGKTAAKDTGYEDPSFCDLMWKIWRRIIGSGRSIEAS